MRFTWAAGVLHALIGSAILFLTLHPLRDALDAQPLEMARVFSAFQALQGIILMVVAGTTRARLAATAIAVGTAISAAMVYFMIFTGTRPPIIVLVPTGGGITLLGLLGLLLVRPNRS